MDCPACNRQLREMEADGVVVDVCENGCGGIWFDNFEIKKVDEQHESAGEKLLDVPVDPSVKVDPTQKRSCPKCGDQTMLKHFMSIKKEVEIDECPACGGVWLDCGELGRIREQYESDDERRQAAEEYFNDVFGPELAERMQDSERKLHGAQRFARVFRFVCPSFYIPGKQKWGAF